MVGFFTSRLSTNSHILARWHGRPWEVCTLLCAFYYVPLLLCSWFYCKQVVDSELIVLYHISCVIVQVGFCVCPVDFYAL